MAQLGFAINVKRSRRGQLQGWFWHWSFSTFGILGILALCVFCPTGDSSTLEMVDTALLKATDQEHRDLVEQRRGLLRV